MNENMQAGASATANTLLVRAVHGYRQTGNLRSSLALICLLLATVCLFAEAVQDQTPASSSKQTINEAQQATGSGTGAINLEELNSMVQQYNEDLASPSNRKLASDIISRLMLDNVPRSSWRPAGELDVIEGLSGDEDVYDIAAPQQQEMAEPTSGASRFDMARLRKLMGMVQSYEEAADNDGHGVFQYASLPISEAATMKRAKMLLMRQQQGGRTAPYSRGSFDFGLGKRAQSFLRRFGELENGQVLPAIQYGKRPAASAHRYDFGLGKRGPSSPRFDFGLGKRSPANRNRFDFGLGRK